MLEFSKEELLSYCDREGIPYGIDESNLKQDYQRNRIRHKKVGKMGPEERNRILREIREKNRKKELHLQKVPLILQKGEFSISQFARIPYLLEYLSLEFPSSSKRFRKEIRRQLLESDSCFFEGQKLCFCKEYGKINVFVKQNDYAFVFENIEQMKDFSCEYFVLKEEGETIEAVYLSEEDFPVTIRNAKPKDQIRMAFGTKKVSRFFIDRKMKREQRMLWPLIENRNGEIVFVAGLGCDINHYCRNSGIFMIKC